MAALATTRRASQTSDGGDKIEKPRRSRPLKTRRDDILSLRDEARALEIVVLRLQRKQLDALSRRAGKWKRLAYDQSEERAAALHENKKLRCAIAECRQLATNLLHLLQQPRPCTQDLGSVEDNEWRLNILGHHPRRRHLNADRIMDELYRQLPGWSIRSGLEDLTENKRFSCCDDSAHTDRPIRLEADLCRQVNGHYVDVASAVWRYFAREDLETGAAASVRVETSEILGDRIRHDTTGFRMVVDGHTMDHTTHQLCRRIDEDARIVILWKAVTEDMGDANLRFTENADGWISFEKASDPDHPGKRCLMKCSSMVLVLPLSHVDPGRGEYLEHLMQAMKLELPAVTTDGDRPERVRRVFTDFLSDMLWRYVSHIERLATSPETSALQVSL